MQLLRSLRQRFSGARPEKTERLGLRAKLRGLLLRLGRERASPREVGQAVALGVWVGTSPAFGLHGWLAVGLATLLKRNPLFAFLGSRVSFFLLLPWIVWTEIVVGHLVRTGTLLDLESFGSEEDVLTTASASLLDWCLGWALLGPLYALVLGVLAVPLWRSWLARRARKQRALSEGTQPPPPPPSSGSRA